MFIISHVYATTGHFYRLLVHMSRLIFTRGLFYHLFVYMSYVDATAGHFYHLFVHISHLTYAVGYFSSFFPYTSHLALLAVFLPETEMFRRWRSVYSLILIYINKKKTYHEIVVSPLPSETRGIRTPDNLIKSYLCLFHHNKRIFCVICYCFQN